MTETESHAWGLERDQVYVCGTAHSCGKGLWKGYGKDVQCALGQPGGKHLLPHVDNILLPVHIHIGLQGGVNMWNVYIPNSVRWRWGYVYGQNTVQLFHLDGQDQGVTGDLLGCLLDYPGVGDPFGELGYHAHQLCSPPRASG